MSLFRIDSLAWQVAAPIYSLRFDRHQAASAVADILRDYGASAAVAGDIGAALTWAL